jgi:cytochrome c5
MNLKLPLSSLLLLTVVLVPFVATPQPKPRPQATQQTTAKTSTKQATTTNGSVHQDDGQRVFEQNCSRCHTAPDGFSTRISGTVLRHMRVRASLSQHDEQALLRFMNP